MPHMSAHVRLGALPLTIALCLALAVPASAQVATLVDPGDEPSPSPDALESEFAFADRDEAILAYAQCMRDNGIDMDDPVAGEPGGRGFFGGRAGGEAGGGELDRFGDEFQSAQQACGAILEAARPETDPEAEQERLDEELALAQCFRENGYPDYPDPSIGSDGRLERGGFALQELGIDRRSEEFQETRMACAEELGVEAFGPGGGPGGFGQGGG